MEELTRCNSKADGAHRTKHQYHWLALVAIVFGEAPLTRDAKGDIGVRHVELLSKIADGQGHGEKIETVDRPPF
jgi:hypothetical protein